MKTKRIHSEAFDNKGGHVFDLWFRGRAFFMLGLVFLFWGYMPWMFLTQYRLRDMQQSGKIVKGRVLEISAVKEKLYDIRMTFAYQVNGISYVSSEVHPERSYNVYEKNDILARLGVDSVVVLRVNPAHPEKAVCFMDDTPVSMPWPFLGTALGLSLFWLGGFFYWQRLE